MRLPKALPVLLLLGGAARADEGMWTFDNVPVARIQASTGFAPDGAWLDHLRLATVRLTGGTGAFVSKDGLVLTNHHVGRGAIQQVSSASANYVHQGFTAASREQELPVPGMELLTLSAFEDITREVAAAAAGAKGEAAQHKAKEDRAAALQQALATRTGLKVDVVTLYQGGETWLYAYEKHTDVRLVAAPEEQVAFFGGDPDNFTFPRHNLDFALFRVYKDGKPYQPRHVLAWSNEGVKAGDAVFVTGHPGSTARQETLAQMTYAREVLIPFRLKAMERQRQALLRHGETGAEAKRLVSDQIFGLENNLKRMKGWLDGLGQAAAMDRVAKAEQDLRAKVMADPALKARAGGSWAAIDKAVARQRQLIREQELVNTRGSRMLGHALTLVRLFAETAKPEGARLLEFKEANLKSLRTALTHPRPIDKGVETALLIEGLQEASDLLGAGHPFVKAMLAGRTPRQAAEAAVRDSQLHEAAFRKGLLEGGAAAIAASADPMLQLARVLDPHQRTVRKRWEVEVEASLKEHGGRINQARFAVYGKTQYPDATFTLRLAYGKVAGYPANGTFIQPFTTYAGLYDRAWGQGAEAQNGAWALPARWQDAHKLVDLATPFNFAYSCDTVGGNSGSPVVNAKGQLVGLNFDGNIEKQANRYFYDPTAMRAIAVDARAITEALRKVMGAAWVVDELTGR